MNERQWCDDDVADSYDDDAYEGPFAVERMLGDETLYRLEQVALPEDGE